MSSTPLPQNGLVPYEWLERSFHNWWFLILTMILGGLCGLVMNRFEPPVYEAKASFAFHIDLTQTGNIGSNDEEVMYNWANNLIITKPVTSQVVAAARAKNIALTPEKFAENSGIERYNEVYELRYRDSDPKIAAEVANLWASTAYAQLSTASLHAQKVHILQTHINALESCLEESGGPLTGQAACSVLSLPQLQANMSAASTELASEMAASRGISSALVFDYSNPAEVPSRPALFARNTFVLVGSLIGFLAGLALIMVGAPAGLLRRLRRA